MSLVRSLADSAAPSARGTAFVAALAIITPASELIIRSGAVAN
jgi:hypothetical protein